MSAIGSCSHCFFDATTDSGARTTYFSGLYFDPLTVPIKIRYQIPHRDIFYDIDGSLTGLGPGTWATPYFLHNLQPECHHLQYEFDGLICNSSIQVRRVVFWNYLPGIMTMQPLNILKIDDSVINQMDNVTMASYFGNTNNYSPVAWRLQYAPY